MKTTKLACLSSLAVILSATVSLSAIAGPGNTQTKSCPATYHEQSNRATYEFVEAEIFRNITALPSSDDDEMDVSENRLRINCIYSDNFYVPANEKIVTQNFRLVQSAQGGESVSEPPQSDKHWVHFVDKAQNKEGWKCKDRYGHNVCQLTIVKQGS